VIRRLDPADPAIAQELVAVQQAAYAVEAGIIGRDVIPAQRETPEQLAAGGLDVLAALEPPPAVPVPPAPGTDVDAARAAAARVVAFVAYRRTGPDLDIHKLVVHPAAFRRGLATRLLTALDAEEPGVRRQTVATAVANGPARALYEGRGFVLVNVREAPGGVRIAELERVLPSSR
jgi:ribosomal protein S18 acetylase RimI-like enzyme